jgi:hypothetical protein
MTKASKPLSFSTANQTAEMHKLLHAQPELRFVEPLLRRLLSPGVNDPNRLNRPKFNKVRFFFKIASHTSQALCCDPSMKLSLQCWSPGQSTAENWNKRFVGYCWVERY